MFFFVFFYLKAEEIWELNLDWILSYLDFKNLAFLKSRKKKNNTLDFKSKELIFPPNVYWDILKNYLTINTLKIRFLN